jgi:excisionase family DNA binding protein
MAEIVKKRAARDPLLKVNEAAEFLNADVRFVRRLIAERRIRFVKLGRHVRIPESAIHELVQAGTVQVARPTARIGWPA